MVAIIMLVGVECVAVNPKVIEVLKNDSRFTFEAKRVIRVEDNIKYIYDLKGVLLEVIYENGVRDLFDKYDRLLEKIYPDGSKDVYAFGTITKIL